MMSNSFPWVAVLGGGLAGAIFNQLFQLWTARRAAPRLDLKFDDKIEGCTRANVPYFDSSTQKRGERKWLRLRVDNCGRSMAKDVQVMVTRVKGKTDPEWVVSGEVLDLVWARSNNQVRMDIPSNTFRFVDVCYAKHKPQGTRLVVFGGRLEALNNADCECELSIDLSVAAANAETVSRTITLCFDGTADGLRIVTT